MLHTDLAPLVRKFAVELLQNCQMKLKLNEAIRTLVNFVSLFLGSIWFNLNSYDFVDAAGSATGPAFFVATRSEVNVFAACF